MTPSNSRSARSRTSQAAAAAPSREAPSGCASADHENRGQHDLAAGAGERRGLLQGDGGTALVVGRDEDAVAAAHGSSRPGTRAAVRDQQHVDALQALEEDERRSPRRRPIRPHPRRGHRQTGQPRVLGPARRSPRRAPLREREEVRAQGHGEALDQVALARRLVVHAPLGASRCRAPRRAAARRARRFAPAAARRAPDASPPSPDRRWEPDSPRAAPGAEVAVHALVDRFRDLPQGDLAQGSEVGGGEEVEQRRVDPIGGIDLARAKARLAAPRGSGRRARPRRHRAGRRRGSSRAPARRSSS